MLTMEQPIEKGYHYFCTFSKKIEKDVGLKVTDINPTPIGNCWKRFQQKWTMKLMNDENFIDPIPSNKLGFVNIVLNHLDYKNRATKEEKDLTQLVKAIGHTTLKEI